MSVDKMPISSASFFVNSCEAHLTFHFSPFTFHFSPFPLPLFLIFVALPANLGDSPLGGLIFEKKRVLSQSERVTTLKQKIS